MHDQVAIVLKAGGAVQHSDRRIALQDAFVLGVAQFIDAGLLLGQQRRALDGRRGSGDAAIERAFPAQMGDMGGADHDLGRHTTDIDAGAADGAALDQRDTCALLDGLQRRCHRGPAAADDGDMQCAAATRLVVSAQQIAHLVEQSARRRN
nr:hypothetical protein HDPBJHLB_00039 [Escherichia coli]